MESNGHHWDEREAVRMLKRLEIVVRYATDDGKIKIPDVAQLHREIAASHDAKDWPAYLKAIQALSRAACKASFERSVLGRR